MTIARILAAKGRDVVTTLALGPNFQFRTDTSFEQGHAATPKPNLATRVQNASKRRGNNTVGIAGKAGLASLAEKGSYSRKPGTMDAKHPATARKSYHNSFRNGVKYP